MAANGVVLAALCVMTPQPVEVQVQYVMRHSEPIMFLFGFPLWKTEWETLAVRTSSGRVIRFRTQDKPVWKHGDVITRTVDECIPPGGIV